MKRQGPPERPTRGMDASPQTGRGHGHTEVSNELLEAVYRFPFTAAQLRALLFVLRDSYGWKRKETLAHTISELAEALDLPRSSAGRAIDELKELGAIEPTIDGGWAPVKNYNAWGNTPSLPLSIVPLAGRPASGRPTGGQNITTGGMKVPASGTLIGEIKLKKERKDGDPQHLPNGKNDTPRNRAGLGSDEHAPEDHPEFKRLSFKRQDELTDEWKESREREFKKNACRNGCGRARASEAWPYCRPCTVCHSCKATPNGIMKFQRGPGGVICTTCADEIK